MPSLLCLLVVLLLACARESRPNGDASSAASRTASASGVIALPPSADGAGRRDTTGVAISEADLRRRLAAFAHDSMMGRAAGSEGHERALRYIEAELARIGLVPAGDTVAGRPRSFRQRVPILRSPKDTLWSANLVAVLPGGDPVLRQEYVALGAHSDHIGVAPTAVDHDSARTALRAVWERSGSAGKAGPAQAATGPARRDSIYNGADDDGSGSMALLEIAEALRARGTPMRRSLLLVWHTAEEIGLNGAEWFVTHPTVPLGKIVAQINVDMIGRGTARDLAGGSEDYIAVIGARRLSTQLGRIVEEVNRAQPRPLTLDYAMDADGHPENIYCRSDHALYAAHGIPVSFFFTNLHADYHEVTDEAQYIDYPHYTRIVAYLASLAERLADADRRPVVDKPRPDPRAPCRQ